MTTSGDHEVLAAGASGVFRGSRTTKRLTGD
jgi:hypothetical protein